MMSCEEKTFEDLFGSDRPQQQDPLLALSLQKP